MIDHQVEWVASRPTIHDHSSQGFNLHDTFRVLWRHKFLVIFFALAGLGLAQVAIWHAVPRYESEAQVILDVRNTTVLKMESVLSGLPSQPEVLRTEMDVIASRSMAERVLDHLSSADIRQLADDGRMATPMAIFVDDAWAKLTAALSSWAQPLDTLIDGNKGSPLQPPLPKRDNLVDLILGSLKVSNDGRSYTIHIGFASPHAELAARLANVYAEQYLANQLDLKTGATRRADEWLSQRLLDLRAQLESADAAVDAFRRQTGILGGKNNTILTQQIADLNAQLVAARNQRIDAESQLRTVQSQLDHGGSLEALADILPSQVLQKLRAKQADLTQQNAQLAGQYTSKYPNTKSLQADMAALQRQIRDEIALVVKSLGNQVQIVRSKEQSLERSIAQLEGELGQGGEAEVKLQQLQRQADSTRSVYEAYLNRFKEIGEQQQLQTPDAYLISRAEPPELRTYPQGRSLIALGLILGLAGGMTMAFVRDKFDRKLRTIVDVENATGVPVVALVPTLSRLRRSRPEDDVLASRGSLYSEALRTIWAAITLDRDQRRKPVEFLAARSAPQLFPRQPSADADGIVILVTSSVPNEGKTAFCVSMARSLSVDGHKVLLIDGDLRRPGVAKSFGASAPGRLNELLSGKMDLHEAVQVDDRSGAHYLSARRENAHPQDVLNSPNTEAVLAEARRCYDLILIDTPPILAAADAAILAKFCDHTLFFVRWGTTSRDCVEGALRRLNLYNVEISGSVLSHVNLRRHARYAAGDGYYRSYGQTPAVQKIVHAHNNP